MKHLRFFFVSSVKLPDEGVQLLLEAAILPEDLKQLNNEQLKAAQKLIGQYSHVFAREK